MAQVVATLFTLVFTGVMTFVIGMAIHKTIGFRVSPEDEARGVDLSEHSESAYSFGEESASYEPLAEDARA